MTHHSSMVQTLRRVPLSAIQMDTSIQCRANIDMAVVNDYRDAMEAGAKFPYPECYGTGDKCWIGDGWHRVLAAQDSKAKEITVNLHPGTEHDALIHALSANTRHGLRRTNDDKRRCVELALKRFPEYSNRNIAELCAVGKDLVECIRPRSGGGNATSRTGRDGKQYPAKPAKTTDAPPAVERKDPDKRDGIDRPPCIGMQYARMAIMDLEQIEKNDSERAQAFKTVRDWIATAEADEEARP